MPKNHNRFLKTTSFVLALGVLALGIFANEKNKDLLSGVEANFNEASVIVEKEAIPTILGNCEQNSKIEILSALQPARSIFASVNNLDAIVTGTASFDAAAMNALSAAVVERRVEVKTVDSGAQYEFVIRDGQADFWKCVLKKNQLFSSITEESNGEAEFFSNTQLFAAQIEKFGYVVEEARKIENFLNFVKLPVGHEILETTVLNSEGEVFFKIFEVELLEDITYNDLRQDLRNRVGITNLRPAVFGADSYYWMWGEDNKMAASVFQLEGKIFGISYQTTHFKHIRRVVDALFAELPFLVKKVELVRKEGGKFENLKLAEFEELSEDDLGDELVDSLRQLEQAEEIFAEGLQESILSVATDDLEPIEIPTPLETPEEVADFPLDLPDDPENED